MSMIVGALGTIFGAGIAVLAAYSASWGLTYLGAFEAGGVDGTLAAPHGAGTVAVGVVRSLLGLLLFVAGLQMVRRRRSGATLSLLWVLLRLLAAIAEVSLLLASVGGWTRLFIPMVVAAGSDEPGLNGANLMLGVLRLAFAAAWPLFLLWWLRQRSHRQETGRWPR